jgi:ribosome-binding protein aMBF1 (putative translation factor)
MTTNKNISLQYFPREDAEYCDKCQRNVPLLNMACDGAVLQVCSLCLKHGFSTVDKSFEARLNIFKRQEDKIKELEAQLSKQKKCNKEMLSENDRLHQELYCFKSIGRPDSPFKMPN